MRLSPAIIYMRAKRAFCAPAPSSPGLHFLPANTPGARYALLARLDARRGRDGRDDKYNALRDGHRADVHLRAELPDGPRVAESARHLRLVRISRSAYGLAVERLCRCLETFHVAAMLV
jgi:hypothetical protein